MSNERELSAEEIRSLVVDLGKRLSADGIPGDIRLVGGAAVIFAGDGRRLTADVDGSYAPKEDVERIARIMSAEYGLGVNWLNDRSKAYIPDGATWVKIEMDVGANIYRATDETLLAMKIAAEREKDIGDIGFLAAKLGLVTPESIVDIAFSMYGEHSIPLAGSRENYEIVAEDGLRREQERQMTVRMVVAGRI